MYKKYTLKNGLRVLISPLSETKAVTVLILLKVGSRYEQKNINGVSHFIEHLIFKGTKKRPTTLDISKELDGIGATYNAFTAKDHTGYYIKANYEKVELALDILSDILFNSKFDQAEIERERRVIMEEINMYEDNPMMMSEDLFEQTIYHGNPLGWQISGSKEVVGKLKREEMIDYFRSFYSPANMLISIAGKIDQRILGLVKKYFSHDRTKKKFPSFSRINIKQAKSRVNLKFKETEQVQLALGFPSYSYFDKRIYPLFLLSVILGGNMSSRLFISIRERLGLCYFIRSSANVYQDTGNLVIQAGLDKGRIDKAIKAILNELKKVVKEGVGRDELMKAKEYIKGKLILDLEDSESIAAFYAKQALLINKIIEPKNYLGKLNSVKLSDIKQVAKDIISSQRLNLSLIGPFKDASSFSKLLKL